jgi:hypothetical protein
LKEVFDALKSLRAYLPSAYATIVPSPKSFDGGTVHTKTLWALFSREQLRNEHLVKQTAIVVAPSSAGSDQYTGEPCGVAKHACDTRFIRAAIGSIASNSEPKAPVLLLRTGLDATDAVVPYLSNFFEEDEVVPVFAHSAARQPSADWLVGDWVTESQLIGILVGSVARARILENELDDTFLERLVEGSQEPLVLYRAAESTDLQIPSEPEAIIVSQSSANGPHRLEMAYDMSCDEALAILQGVAERGGVEEVFPVVVTSPALVR